MTLAPCKQLSLSSEEKRREEEKLTPKPPGQAVGGLTSALTLRPYQANAVQNLRLGLAGGVLRLMLCSPTGSGKTEIGMALVKGARAKHKRVAFLCNRVHLVEQTSRR
jgi:superfamily II DNA or RNA helicase